MKLILYVLVMIVFTLAPACTETATVSPNSTPLPTITQERITSLKFGGQVSRGQTYEKQILQNLFFRLMPYVYGWDIWIGNYAKPENNFVAVVTPPYHGMNARHVEGWHFRNSDNSGPNEPGQKNVNAPQHERRFCFALNEVDYQTAYDWLNEQSLPSKEARQQVRLKQSLLKPQAGVLRITELKLGNLVIGEQAWIEHMEFEVALGLSRECELY